MVVVVLEITAESGLSDYESPTAFIWYLTVVLVGKK